MKAISLWQPWASLLVTPQPCGLCFWGEQHTAERHSMVKRIETRSWPCPPKLIGQRIAFHAAKRKPEHNQRVGDVLVHEGYGRHDWHVTNLTLTGMSATRPLPLGCIVGSGVVTACLPITGEHDDPLPQPRVERTDQSLLHSVRGPYDWTDVTDQLPYGDFTPGRWAWIIEDAAPTTDRCPWCLATGLVIVEHNQPGEPAVAPCSVCDGAGRCEPIPFKGQQGFFNLPDDIAAKLEAAT